MMNASPTVPRVPGSRLLGSLHELRSDRLGFMKRIVRDVGDIAQLRIGTRAAVLIGSAELAGQVLVDKAEAFIKAPSLRVFARPLFGNGLLTSEHDFHARQRRMMAPLFAPRRIAAFAQVMTERTLQRQRGWHDGAIIDVSDEMMRLTLEVVGKTLLGAEVGAEADEIGGALTVCMESVNRKLNSVIPLRPGWPTPANLRNRRAIARLDRTIYRLIEARRAQRSSDSVGGDSDDLLSMLLAARDDADGSRMDDRQIRDELMTIFLAGHETTANALSWAHYLLGRHPAVSQRLRAEVDQALRGQPACVEDLPRLPFVLQVLKETLRLYPPAYAVTRTAERDVEIGGHVIKAGAIVVISIIAIHHRDTTFADPDHFDPTRFEPQRERLLPRHAFMPFGAGPRVCIGNHFALMEGHLMLATIAQGVRLDRLSDDDVVVPDPLITLRPKGGIHMRVHRRDALAGSAVATTTAPAP